MYREDEVRIVNTTDKALAAFFKKIYLWMSIGIGITGFTAYLVSTNVLLKGLLFSNRFVFYGLVFVQLGVVIFLSARIMKMSFGSALFWFFFYSFLTGLTFSWVFLAYTGQSIATVFFITAGTFAAMSIYGFTTGQDLSKYGNILFMGLIGIVIASLVNFFLKSDMLYWIISVVGVVVFVGLVAYDTNKLKRFFYQASDEGVLKQVSVFGALQLYLDFINLFLMLLRIFGRRK